MPEQIKQEQTIEKEFKLFDKYSTEEVKVKDNALRPYINLRGKLLAKSYGRQLEKLAYLKASIVERLANRLAVPGHVGKKHKIITSWSSGKYNRNMKTILIALDIVEKKTGQNPVQILVNAIENGSPRDEITVIEQAGARYPQAVDTSPIRRINLAIRWIVQGAYAKSFGKRNKMADTLANEIMAAAKGGGDSYCMIKKNESEKQADAAR